MLKANLVVLRERKAAQHLIGCVLGVCGAGAHLLKLCLLAVRFKSRYRSTELSASRVIQTDTSTYSQFVSSSCSCTHFHAQLQPACENDVKSCENIISWFQHTSIASRVRLFPSFSAALLGHSSAVPASVSYGLSDRAVLRVARVLCLTDVLHARTSASDVIRGWPWPGMVKDFSLRVNPVPKSLKLSTF